MRPQRTERILTVLANFVYREKGNFLYPFPSPFPLPKTERKKDQRKEKRQKKGTKNRENFLQFFPVDPPIFLSQKEEKRKEITKFSFSISYSLRRKKREKKREKGEKTEEKKQKEMKAEIKRRVFHFSLILNMKFEGREKEENDPFFFPFPVPISQK